MDPRLQNTARTNNGPVPIGANLWITGLGTQYPPYFLAPEKLDQFANKFYDVESPG
jgi:type III polyketide synthase